MLPPLRRAMAARVLASRCGSRGWFPLVCDGESRGLLDSCVSAMVMSVWSSAAPAGGGRGDGNRGKEPSMSARPWRGATEGAALCERVTKVPNELRHDRPVVSAEGPSWSGIWSIWGSLTVVRLFVWRRNGMAVSKPWPSTVGGVQHVQEDGRHSCGQADTPVTSWSFLCWWRPWHPPAPLAAAGVPASSTAGGRGAR